MPMYESNVVCMVTVESSASSNHNVTNWKLQLFLLKDYFTRGIHHQNQLTILYLAYRLPGKLTPLLRPVGSACFNPNC